MPIRTKIDIIALILLGSALLLHARENPFVPVIKKDSYTLTDNNYTALQPLKRVTMTLPSSARVVKSMQISFINLDGSITTKRIAINQSVDWHLPLFLSQSIDNGSSAQKIAEHPKKIHHKKSAPKKTAITPFFSFSHHENRCTLFTNDALLRHFGLSKPNRIVLDFKRDANFRTFTHTLKTKYFKKIQLGNHKGYYRCVIELDGLYGYSLTQNKSAISITLQ